MSKSRITDEIPPTGTDPLLSEYLTRMFRLARISDETVDQLPIEQTLPAKPIVGKVYYFGRAIPATSITQEGYWGYLSTGAWTLLG